MNQPAAHVDPLAPEQALPPEAEKAYRKLCDWLAHWRHCGEAPCRRAHRCVGAPDHCFNRHWARYPEPVREWVRAGERALLREGCSARAARCAADYALLLHLKKQAGLPLFTRSRRGRIG
jgi:hypothetical protein